MDVTIGFGLLETEFGIDLADVIHKTETYLKGGKGAVIGDVELNAVTQLALMLGESNDRIFLFAVALYIADFWCFEFLSLSFYKIFL